MKKSLWSAVFFGLLLTLLTQVALAAEKLDWSHLAANPPLLLKADGTPDTADDLPSSYDPRTWYGLPPVRVGARNFDTSWAFAAIGAAESNAIRQGIYDSDAIDLSEMYLAYFVYGDSRPGKSFPLRDESRDIVDQGGNASKAIAFMSRQGAIDQADLDHLNSESYKKPAGFPEDYAQVLQLRAAYQLGFGGEKWVVNDQHQQVLTPIYMDVTQRNLAKRIIMEHGAVQVSYFSDDDSYYCPDSLGVFGACTNYLGTSSTTSYFNNSQKALTNLVELLVGWDDNFPRENFGVSAEQWPQNNGAWLVRRSNRGALFGEEGYFWMSYEQYVDGGTVYIVKAADNSLRHYGYDDLGHTSSISDAWSANVFRAPEDKDLAVQEIAFYTTDNNAQYMTYIYDLGTKAPPSSPIDGSLLRGEGGQKTHAGYHRKVLSRPVYVDARHYFSVIVKLHNPTATAVEKHEAAVVNAGESWFSSDGASWVDGTSAEFSSHFGSPANATIKAFASETIADLVAPSIQTTELPDGKLGAGYIATLSATGGGITWQKISGTLPPGLTLSSRGIITGTPTKEGSFDFTVEASNSKGSDTKNLTLTVGTLSIQTATLPNGTPGIAYDYTLTATGAGTAYITWSKTSGSLPPGLTLSSGGRITGTPTSEGSFTFTVKASSSKDSDTKTLTIKVSEIPEITAPNILPNAAVRTSYSFMLTSTGATPITWSKDGGTLPPGLSLSSGGSITGTPTSEGTFTFTVKANNSKGSDTKRLIITVGEAPAITTTSLPDATVGTSYNVTLAATGTGADTESLSWSRTSGTLPPGLNFFGGIIYGTPTSTGTFTFTVEASNPFGSDSKALTIKVVATVPPKILTSQPDGSPLKSGYLNVAYNATLVAEGTQPITWSKTSDPLPPGLTLSSDGRLTGTPTQVGVFRFAVTASNSAGSDTKTLTLAVLSGGGANVPPKILTSQPDGSPLKSGYLNVAYNATLVAEGTQPITWSKTSDPLPPGLTLSSDGRLTGTPTQVGVFRFAVTASNSAGSDTKTLTLAVLSGGGANVPPKILTSLQYPLYSGYLHEAYSATLIAEGTQPITWSKTSDPLPPGLSLSSDGQLTGTPTQVGDFSFRVTATNSAGSDTRTLGLFVLERVAIQTTSLPNGKLGAPYATTLTAKGTPPITWSVYSGTLPPGLSLSADGRISGTPTREGTFSFTVKADFHGVSDTKSLTITVGNPPEITTNVLPGVAVNTNYSFTLTAKGKAPITWSGESLPSWLKLAANGRLTGRPTALGEHTFTVKAVNATGETTKTLTLAVGTKPAITTTALPGGVVGEDYSAEFDASGTTPVRWTLASGKLPPGLDFISSHLTLFNSSIKILGGTPTKQGTYSFSMKATNEFGSVTKAFKIVIGERPTITTQTLKGAIVGMNYSATLAATGTKKITWDIVGGALPPGMTLAAANGRLSGKPLTQGDYPFTVRATNPIGETTKTLTIKVGEKPKIATTALPDGVVDEAYRATLTATGTGPITWTVNGKLPDWLTLSEGGTLSGTPMKQGTYTVTAKAVNEMGFVTKALRIVVGERPVITTQTLKGAIVGTNYSATLAATGTKKITWDVVGGALPPGMTLAAANGRLSGKPTVQGTYDFTVRATNAMGAFTKPLSIKVGEKPKITTTALPGGTVNVGYSATLEATGTGPITWTVNGKLPDWLTLSESGVLSGTPSKPGTYTVTAKAVNEMGFVTKALRIVISK